MFTNSHKTTSNPLNWYWFNRAFSDEEIQKIEEYAQTLPRQNGRIGNSEADTKLRKSVVRWIYRNPETEWLFAKIMKLADTANENLWQFDMFSSSEDDAIQYTEYYDNGGHYDWHIDMSGGIPLNQRKISMTVQLSNSEDYEGGEFEIMRGQNVEQLQRNKGTVLLFPSYILHRVSPVTNGIRKSLVIWLGGSSFK